MLVAVVLTFTIHHMAPDGDLIESLPGYPGDLPSKHYSGYLDLAGTSKHIHYYLVTSESKAQNPPVIVWLNGGPGCSSMDGLFYEHGPFRIDESDHTKLKRFDYGWQSLGHMLYLESPVGVGFSYSDEPSSDYKQNDDQAAEDNLAALEAFYKLFPEYLHSELFITGESYAGVYVPTFAEAILKSNTYTGAPLSGIAVGNGCSGNEIGSCGGSRVKYDALYLLGTAFLPRSLKDAIMSACDFETEEYSEKCQSLLETMHETVGHINLYDIYGECIRGLPQESNEELRRGALGLSSKANLGGPDACIDSISATAYVNRSIVREALHVHDIDFTWATCATAPGWSYRSTRPNLPRDTYPALAENFRVIIYNGDWDACVPYTDNEAWTEGMGYEVLNEWHPWTYLNSSQVGGYATNYKVPKGNGSFSFVTIRGGRHEVPETAPQKALQMISNLITGKEF